MNNIYILLNIDDGTFEEFTTYKNAEISALDKKLINFEILIKK